MIDFSSGDIFLSVLTSTRSLPYNGTNSVFSIMDATLTDLDFSGEHTLPYMQWLIMLEEQGYIFINKAENKVQIESAFLCRSAINKNEVYLCGARICEFVDWVSIICKDNGLIFKVESNEKSYPSRISINGNEVALQNFSAQINLPLQSVPYAYIVALQDISLENLVLWTHAQRLQLPILHFPSISEAIDSLDSRFNTTDISLPRSELEFFNPTTLMFDGEAPTMNNPYSYGRRNYNGWHNNLYRREYNGNIQVCTDVIKNYAKYYCLSKSGIKLAYNKSQKTIFIPKYCRLPLKQARSISHCQCSPPKEIHFSREDTINLGLSPSSNSFLQYNGIPEVIVEMIAKQLNMTICIVH